MNPLTNSSMFTNANDYFGSMKFTMGPLGVSKLHEGFPAIPDTDLNQIAMELRLRPRQMTSGNTKSVQSIQGQQTIVDNSGTTRMVMGYAPGQF